MNRNLPILHDETDQACRCHFCFESRWREEQEAIHAAAMSAERERTLNRAEREVQLRLPMTPIPHCADQPRHLPTGGLQPEMFP